MIWLSLLLILVLSLLPAFVLAGELDVLVAGCRLEAFARRELFGRPPGARNHHG